MGISMYMYFIIRVHFVMAGEGGVYFMCSPNKKTVHYSSYTVYTVPQLYVMESKYAKKELSIFSFDDKQTLIEQLSKYPPLLCNSLGRASLG